MAKFKELFPGVFEIDGKLATKNLIPGKSVYGEKRVTIDEVEYRFWDPYRSKLSAAIKNGLKELQFNESAKVLYLGAANGTTPSHISDIIGQDGEIFCVEFSQRAMRDLITVSESRPNMFPILADARKPESYAKYLPKKIDFIYQDVAQKDQVRILEINSDRYQESGSRSMLALKSQSIDASKNPKEVFNDASLELEKNFEINQSIKLEPYDKDHMFFTLTRF